MHPGIVALRRGRRHTSTAGSERESTTATVDATQVPQDPNAKVQDVTTPVAAHATQAPQDPSAKVQDVTGSSTPLSNL